MFTQHTFTQCEKNYDILAESDCNFDKQIIYLNITKLSKIRNCLLRNSVLYNIFL